MTKVVLCGAVGTPLADIAAFLRERGVASSTLYFDDLDLESGRLSPLRAARGNGSSDFGFEKANGPHDSNQSTRYAIAVCWGKAAGCVNKELASVSAAVVVVVGQTKQDVIAACVDSDADYAVLWPKEKELLATVVLAEMGADDPSTVAGLGARRVAVSSVKSAGSTILAANLASVLSSGAQRVCLFDLDARFHELTELLLDDANAADSRGQRKWVRSGSVQSVADAIYTASDEGAFELLATAESLPELAEADVALFDIPGRELFGRWVRTGAEKRVCFDHFLLVVPLDYFGLRQAGQVLETIDGNLVDTLATAVFCSSRGSGPRPEDALKLLGERQFFELPWIPEEASGAIDEGRLLAPSKRNSFGSVLDEIASWITAGFMFAAEGAGVSFPAVGVGEGLRRSRWIRA